MTKKSSGRLAVAGSRSAGSLRWLRRRVCEGRAPVDSALRPHPLNATAAVTPDMKNPICRSLLAGDKWLSNRIIARKRAPTTDLRLWLEPDMFVRMVVEQGGVPPFDRRLDQENVGIVIER